MSAPDFAAMVTDLANLLSMGTTEFDYKHLERALHDAYAAGRRDMREEAARVAGYYMDVVIEFAYAQPVEPSEQQVKELDRREIICKDIAVKIRALGDT